MVETFDSWIQQVGPAAYGLLFFAALLEYVFPPFPGDSIVLLGGVYAVRGEKSWLLVFLAVTLGSVLGSAFDYFVGLRLARRIELHPRTPWWGKGADKLHGLQAQMRHRGAWLLVANRFLPAARALIFVAAGASQLPFGRTLLLGALSAAAWNLLLMGVGIAVGGNAERLEGIVRQYTEGVLILVGAVVLALVVKLVWRSRRAPGPTGP